MARGTHADATRHARPRGRATRALREAQVVHRARTRGAGHASPRGRPCGAPRGERGRQVKGPRVSGPW